MKRSLAPLVLLLAAVPPAAAQEPPVVDAGVCETGRITQILIDNHSIFDTSDPDLDERLDWAYSLANRLHRRTRADVIRRELVLREGDCYDPFLLEDSERLLRSLGFLSDVELHAVQQDDGSYHIVVDTRDEWSTRVDVRLDMADGFGIDGVSLEEANLLGTGRSVEVFYLDRRLDRSYGAAFSTPQMLGTRWNFATRAGRTRAGTFFEQSVSYPFVGESGRWAMRQAFRRSDRLFDMVAGGVPEGVVAPSSEVHLLLPTRDKGMEVGVVRRYGRRGGLGLLGGGLSFQEVSYPGGRDAAILVHGHTFDDSTSAHTAYLDPVWSTLEEVQNIRAFLLLGHRSIDWVERDGLDAFDARQDVRIGSEVGLAIGRSLPGLETADDLFTTLTMYLGLTPGERSLVMIDSRVDARRDFDAPVDGDEWRDVIGHARLLAYWRPPKLTDHSLLLRVAGSAGWNNVVPFQLTLGGPNSLRGYDDWRFPGAHRVLLTLEDRIFIGWPFPDLWDIGATVHVDAGRIWPGDLPFPYGLDSGWKASAGIGLRGNFPAGGRTTYRLDVAMPLGGGLDFGATRVLLSIGESVGLGGPDRPDIERSRLSGVTGDVFNFPR